ncbi:MAG TPA: PIG-L family deacetylase [Egibacteraceae bacterium]|nr:PIG-L family deacetylase [Egibacteraceae bacterium]
MALRRIACGVARRAARSLPPAVREVGLALAARAVDGPALLPGPPTGPVLVVAPHPDDETIGCGGAIARHVDRGDAVTVLVATSGEATSGGSRSGRRVGGERERECRAACATLGAREPVFARLPDGALAEHAVALAAVIAEHGRDCAAVYAPSLLDPHRDHRAANTALVAAGLGADVYGYEVWTPAPADVLLDVTGVYPRKEAALRCYAVALESVDYVRTAAGLAAYRSAAGGLGGRGHAEAFIRLAAAEHARLAARAGVT